MIYTHLCRTCVNYNDETTAVNEDESWYCYDCFQQKPLVKKACLLPLEK